MDSVSSKEMAIAAIDNDTATASLVANEHGHLTLLQSLKKWRRVSLYCLGMTTGILMYGYDYVIVGTTAAMPSFQHDFGTQLDGKWIIPSLWLGLWNFASPGSSMIGSIIAGWFQDRFGRRASLAVGSFLSALAVGMLYVSNLPVSLTDRRILFFAGKAFQGGAVGMVMATIQTYMSEILPPNLRGPLLAFIPIFTLLGQLIGAGVVFGCLNLDNGYIVCFATQWPFSIVPIIMAFVAPESPTYLIRKGQDEKAYKAQKKLAADGIDTDQVINTIRQNIEHERTQTKATYVDCFRQVHIRRTLIIMFANFMPQLFGLGLLAKGSYFIQVVGMEANLSIMIQLLGTLFGLLANIVSIGILHRVGRRRLILVSMGIMTVLWGSVGVVGIWDGTVTIWYTATGLILVAIIAGFSSWPACAVVAAETSALNLRAKSLGIGWFTSGAAGSIFGLGLPYIFNPDQGDLGARTGFVYAGLCALGWILSWLCVPEMKGRTAGEIDRMFDLGLRTREFRKWTIGDSRKA